MVYTQGQLTGQTVRIKIEHAHKLYYGPQNIFHDSKKWRVNQESVFISVLVETQNISPPEYVIKKVHFAMFPAAHYRRKSTVTSIRFTRLVSTKR
jgi:hypothetical protein